MQPVAIYLDAGWGHGIAMSSSDRKFMRVQSNKKLGNVRNGKWKEFNKRAVLIAEGNYVNNLKHGVWREYYDNNGALMIEEVYNHGIPHGRFASYHPNGQLLSEGNFHHGRREGYFKIYDENGNHTRNILFLNNNEIEDVEYKHLEEHGSTSGS